MLSRPVRFSSVLSLLTSIVLAGACAPAEPEVETPEPAAEVASSPADTGDVEVRVTDYAFHAPAQLRSGWNSFRFVNEGEEPHFLLLWKLPEGVDFGQYAEQVPATFGKHYEPYAAGEIDQEELFARIGGELPAWFGEVEGSGAVGVTSPGLTSQSTVYLAPGEYVMECYAKTDEPKFHGELGMLRPLIVTEESTGLAEPEADIRLTISNYDLQVDGDLVAGTHVFAVEATAAGEGLLGHDIHLARLEGDTTVEELITWIDWVDALQPPAPAQFLGGVDEVGVGRANYFTATLEPGRYVLMSESYAAQGVMHEFEVE